MNDLLKMSAATMMLASMAKEIPNEFSPNYGNSNSSKKSKPKVDRSKAKAARKARKKTRK